LPIEIVGLRRVEGTLDPGESEGRRDGEMLREPLRLGHQPVVVDRFPDESPGFGLLRRQRLSQQCESARAGGADKPRQKPGAAGIRHQPDLGEGLDEVDAPRGEYDVAGKRDVGAGAGGDAVDRGDNWKRQGSQFPNQRIVVGLDGATEVRPGIAAGGAIGEILSGAEAAARAGQQQGAAGGI